MKRVIYLLNFFYNMKIKKIIYLKYQKCGYEIFNFSKAFSFLHLEKINYLD